MHQARLLISGKVQGVFYRASCEEVALKYGLNGWVRNLSSGQVEVVVQGEEDKVKKLIEWCKKGPPHASIANIDIKWEEVMKQLQSFEVL